MHASMVLIYIELVLFKHEHGSNCLIFMVGMGIAESLLQALFLLNPERDPSFIFA